jgi:hypothetical protein
VFGADDMVNFAAQEGVVFVYEAVLAPLVGAARDKPPKLRADIDTHNK